MSTWRSSSTRSCVSVPVLSVARTSIAPRFWIEASRFTITRLRDIANAPLVRLTVITIGSISGAMPTPTAMANTRASIQLPLVSPLISSTAGTMTNMKRMMSHR